MHNDISPDHVLVDPSDGALVGLIDFADAMCGDPVLDLAGLVGWAGFGFCEQVLDAYTLPIDDEVGARLRWASRTLGLIWLGECEGGDDLARHQAWVRRSFEDA